MKNLIDVIFCKIVSCLTYLGGMVFAFLIISSYPHEARCETITIAADNWCPYNCDPKSKLPGYMVEITKKAFARHNIDVEYIILPWRDAVEQARMGKYTAIIGADYMDAPDFIFPNISQGLMYNAFYIKKGDLWRFSNLDSLKDTSLGAITDYSYNALLNEYIDTNKNNKSRVQLETGDNALRINIDKLLTGKVRTIIEAENVMKHYLATHEMVGLLEEAGRLRPSEQDNIYIAFSPREAKAQKYANILSQETKAMRASGELKKILSAYGLNDWER